MKTSVCKVCNMVDTYKSNGDVDWCDDCHSIEQGFIFVEDWNDDGTIVVDEDGMLYDEDFNLIGSEI